MAWQGSEPGTASSQWFVTLADFPGLEQATVIGEVVEGMATIDRIAQVSTYRDCRPVHRVVIEEIQLIESASDVAMKGETPRPE